MLTPDEIISQVSDTRKPYILKFPETSAVVIETVYEETSLTPFADVNLRLESIPVATFHISSWSFEGNVKSVIENTGLRNLRGLSEHRDNNLEDIDMGYTDYNTPIVRRGSSVEYSVRLYKSGFLSGSFRKLLEAFLTGHVTGKFNADIKARLLIREYEKTYPVFVVRLPVQKVNIVW